MILVGPILLAHLVGDYLLQNDWMAANKTRRWIPAVVHGATYTLPFLFVTQSLLALLAIGGTHVLIDHYRLARFWPTLLPPTPRHDKPGWLLIVVDNAIHVLINLGAVMWL